MALSERKALWVPPDVESMMTQRKLEVWKGLNGFAGPEELFPLGLTRRRVRRSLERFAQSQTESGEFEKRVQDELKEGAILDPQDLILSIKRGPGRRKGYVFPPSVVGMGVPDFYIDGNYAFVLSVRQVAIGVCGGFSFVNWPYRWKTKRNGLNTSDLLTNAVIINQLQMSIETPEDREIFPHFRRERILVGLICDWTHEAGSPEVFLLPAAHNEYPAVRESPEAKVRYDVTARRYGFRREKEGDPYRLSLVSFPPR